MKALANIIRPSIVHRAMLSLSLSLSLPLSRFLSAAQRCIEGLSLCYIFLTYFTGGTLRQGSGQD